MLNMSKARCSVIHFVASWSLMLRYFRIFAFRFPFQRTRINDRISCSAFNCSSIFVYNPCKKVNTLRDRLCFGDCIFHPTKGTHQSVNGQFSRKYCLFHADDSVLLTMTDLVQLLQGYVTAYMALHDGESSHLFISAICNTVMDKILLVEHRLRSTAQVALWGVPAICLMDAILCLLSSFLIALTQNMEPMSSLVASSPRKNAVCQGHMSFHPIAQLLMSLLLINSESGHLSLISEYVHLIHGLERREVRRERRQVLDLGEHRDLLQTNLWQYLSSLLQFAAQYNELPAVGTFYQSVKDRFWLLKMNRNKEALLHWVQI